MPHSKATHIECIEVPVGSPHYYIALSIRKEVFVIEQRVPIGEEIDPYEAQSRHYLLRQHGQAVGAGRWRHTDKGIKIERMAISKRYRHQGLGQHLLTDILAAIAVHTAGQQPYIYLHAQQTAISFYKRAGFCEVGRLFYECDIPHMAMYKP